MKTALTSFLDDYSEGAHPALLQKLIETNLSQQTAYGEDEYSKKAKDCIRRHVDIPDVAVHFVASGTMANILAIGASLRPYEAVIAVVAGHIVVRETGAIEAIGHKIITAPAQNGKLTPEAIRTVLANNAHYPHMAKPKLVYISNATEVGTIYTKAEIKAVSELCREKNLLLLLDGARMGTALTAKKSDLTLADIASLVDIFWIGGTKVGMLLGEAIVIPNKRIAEDFTFQIKQRGGLLSKGRVLGVQFLEAFSTDLFFQLSRHANAMAQLVSAGIRDAGYELDAETETNQVFAILPDAHVTKLNEEYAFYSWEKKSDGRTSIRLVTSWATTEATVVDFVKRLKEQK